MPDLHIDFNRFALLTMAMALTACAPSAPTAAPPKTIMAVPEAEPAPEPPSTILADPGPERAPEAACDNDVGEVSCSFIDGRRFSGPACEGFEGSCGLLQKAYGYRKRVGAAVARCWEATGPRSCDMQVRKSCFRKALAEACPNPEFEPFCAEVIERCQARRQRPDFSVGECVKALSSLEGGNLEWAKSALGPSAEGCQLMFPVY